MTIAPQTPITTALGNGSTTVFNFDFSLADSSDLIVVITDSDGVQSQLNPSLYTVVLNAIPVGELWHEGGSVTYPLMGSPLAAGNQLSIVRTIEYDQEVSISNQGAFYPQAVEQALDLLEMQIQQVQETTLYSLQVPYTDSTTPTLLPPAAERANGVLGFDADGQPTIVTSSGGGGGGGGSGTVTSVAMTVPTEFSVSGSPITDAGTLAVTKATQTANTLWAGPTTGSAAQPAFRALVLADLPADAGTVSSVGLSLDTGLYTVFNSPIVSTGSLVGTLSTQAANRVFASAVSGGVAKPSFRALVEADLPVATSSAFGAVKPDNTTITISGGVISATTSGTGTVTSVALSLDTLYSISGSPITSSGTLHGTLNSQLANVVLAGATSGGAAVPTFRALVAADLPLATTGAFGAVKPDGTTVTISGGVISAPTGGAGTVTSVGLSLPGIFSVSGSPVINTGTLTGTLVTQSANLVWAGPTTGSAAAPTFRSLVTADFPTSGVSANTYGDSTHVAQITVDTTGRLTAVSNVAVSGGGGGSEPSIAPWLVVPANPGYDPQFSGLNTLSNSNKTLTPVSGTGNNQSFGTTARYTGKYYLEASFVSSSFASLGLASGAGHNKNGQNILGTQVGQIAWRGSNGVVSYCQNIGTTTATTITTIATFASNNRVSLAVDIDNALIWFRTTSGNWNNNGSADPATGVGGIDLTYAWSGASNMLLWPAMMNGSTSAQSLFLLAADFTQTVPSGFASWSGL